MRLDTSRLINEHFHASEVTAAELEKLLAGGWRHFGKYFFRYNFGFFYKDVRPVLPLRIKLDEFELSKSQRRVLNKNRDVELKLGEPVFDNARHAMFRKHAERFDFGKPDSIYTFLGHEGIITDVLEYSVYVDGILAAVSYFDVAEKSVSSIYAMFDPDFSKRSLGIFTMLKEIEYAKEQSKEFLYQGYAYFGESFYDYKKHFSASQYYDWFGTWREYSLELEK